MSESWRLQTRIWTLNVLWRVTKKDDVFKSQLKPKKTNENQCNELLFTKQSTNKDNS